MRLRGRRHARLKAQVAELQRSVDRLLKLAEDDRATSKRVAKLTERIAEQVGRHGLTSHLSYANQSLASLQRAAHLPEDAIPYPERLTARRFRLLSQNEEDGVTLGLLQAAGLEPRRFVEIGCGTNGGNSGFLVDELGWSGLMVDASDDNVRTVRSRFNPELLTAAQAWVTRENVAELLRDQGFDGELGFLSIDIDGNDYWVWEALDSVSPRVACLEYNSAWGPDRAVVVPYDPGFHRRSIPETRGHYYGASLAALAALGARKGYRLVTTDHRGVNAYFLRDDVAPEIPACAARRAYRLLDKYANQRARGFELWDVVEAQGLEVVDVG